MFWLGPFRQHRNNNRENIGDNLLRELKLSPDQRQVFKDQRRRHVYQLRILQQKDRAIHARFFDMVFSQQKDSAKFSAMIDSLLLIRKEMELLTFNHFSTLQSMLNEEQKHLFRKNFRFTLEKVMPPPRPIRDIPEPPPPPPPSN
jgi:Spy/CpxP family protein refolding chaperone